MIYFADGRDHAIRFLIVANILPLLFLYYEYVSSLMHDINNINAPLNILKLIQKMSSIHTYSTRSSNTGKFYVQSTRLEIHISRFGGKLWNETPCSLGNLPKKEFKREIRQLLLDIILVKENDYIETPSYHQIVIVSFFMSLYNIINSEFIQNS